MPAPRGTEGDTSWGNVCTVSAFKNTCTLRQSSGVGLGGACGSPSGSLRWVEACLGVEVRVARRREYAR